MFSILKIELKMMYYHLCVCACVCVYEILYEVHLKVLIEIVLQGYVFIIIITCLFSYLRDIPVTLF